MNASNTSGAPLTECEYNSTNGTDMYYEECEWYPLPDYPSTETDAEVSIGLKVFLGIVYCLIVMTCGFGNLLLISVIVWFKKARTMTNTLIANLALSDFLVAVFCLPFNLDYYIIKSRMWTHSHVTCVAVHFLRQTSLYVSTNALLVIAIDRFPVDTKHLDSFKKTKPIFFKLNVDKRTDGSETFDFLSVCLPIFPTHVLSTHSILANRYTNPQLIYSKQYFRKLQRRHKYPSSES
ncbi:pancreatic polypeptide receptor [Branchiostoma belcheri]|nr:pancreatic polypeptide receptor [Branchiostoma belcheri]